MAKVIITGGTGFIGKHLVNRLLHYGKCSIALVSNTHNFDSGFFGQIRPEEKSSLRLYTADIRDKNEISKIFRNERADTCIHLAAKISVSDSIRNPGETMGINVKGTENILEACYENEVCNFIFASSAAVYGDVKKLPIIEDCALNPLSPYGTSKMLAEQCILSHSKSKKIKNSVILRIFNVYGRGQTSQSDVITKFAISLKNKLPPLIHGDGMHTRDFISVNDVVDSFLLSSKLLEEKKKRTDDGFSSPFIFNIGTGIPTSISALAQKMIEIFHLDLKPVYQKEGETKGVILHSYADITKAREILHFVPKIAIDEGLREMKDPMPIRK